MVLIDLICQELNSIFVGNILDHKSSPRIEIYILGYDFKIIGVIVFCFIIEIWVDHILIAVQVIRIVVCGGSYGLVLLTISWRRVILPDIFIGLLILLCILRFYLFDLLPIKLSAVLLYFLQNLIASHPENLRRLHLPSLRFIIIIYWTLRLLSFYVIIFHIWIKLPFFAVYPRRSVALNVSDKWS